MSPRALDYESLNENVKRAQYAVRGELYLRASELQKEGKKIIFTNVGNPHALGQKPLTFPRQVVALCQAPFLLDDPNVGLLFPADAIAKAKHYLSLTTGGLGAYSDSRGLPGVRKEVAEFIERRDGYPSDPELIYLTDGASKGVMQILNTIIRGEGDGVLVPVPQYPLYSAAISLFGGSLVPYFLEETENWGLDINNLRQSVAEARFKGITVRAMVIINPGNPTGQCLSEANLREILKYCNQENLVLLGDEVYQQNIYQDERPFISAKKVLMDMGPPISKELQLVSFHTVSKGYWGECGQRRKHRNSSHQNKPPSNSQPFKYGPSNQAPQVPSSTKHEPKTNMVSLPYGHVDSTLRALACQAEGFGHSAIGGLHGSLYHVTTLADDGPGSLREGCRNKEPLWIVFEVSGTIHLSSYLNVSSYKTIDGRGQRIKLTGKGLRLKECEHVIICNLEFEGGRGPDIDAIQIKPNSKHIWIDRCTLRDYDDGLIDITRESTDITVSRCHFLQHDKTMLIGADPSHIGDRCIRVTIHHCFFDGTKQRHPRVRYGKVHLYNNYTRNWGIYAVCASVESQIYSQCNIYEAGQKRVAFKYLAEKATDREEAKTGCINSEGDLFISATQAGLMTKDTAHKMFHPSEHYPIWTVEPPTDDLKQFLQHCTGWQSVPRPADQKAVA